MTRSSRSELSVGEVAARSGVAVSTVHFYEANGLIEGWRTQGNQRRFPRLVLRRIAIIRIAQRAGIPLKTIRSFLANVPADKALAAKDWDRLARSWQAMIDERLTGLLQLRDQLDGCIGCGCLSLKDCPLRNAEDRLARLGPGPRLLMDGDA